MTAYGYARVSTDEQTLESQVAALKAAGSDKVYSEKQSGAKTDRAALAKPLAVLSAGDVLVSRGSLAWHEAPVTSSTCWRRSLSEGRGLLVDRDAAERLELTPDSRAALNTLLGE
jgi:hypothetical protein